MKAGALIFAAAVVASPVQRWDEDAALVQAPASQLDGNVTAQWGWSSQPTCPLNGVCSGGRPWDLGRTCSCPSQCTLQRTSRPPIRVNGCGAERFPSFNPIVREAGRECCNDHDRCYGVFGANQRTCDLTMRNCFCSVGYDSCAAGYAAYALLTIGGATSFDATQRTLFTCHA